MCISVDNPAEMVRRSVESESPSQHPAAAHVVEYGRDSERERRIYYSASPATQSSPNERSQSSGRQMSPFYSVGSRPPSHGSHLHASSDRKRSPHPLVSIPPMSLVEQHPAEQVQKSAGGRTSPVVMHPKHHWRAAAYGLQWPPPSSSRADHRSTTAGVSPRCDSRFVAFDSASGSRSESISRCAVMQKYDGTVEKRSFQEDEAALNFPGNKSMTVDSLNFTSGDRLHARSPASESR